MIDTDIRHVMGLCAYLFSELGLSAEEGKQMQATSQKQINDTRRLKNQFMSKPVESVARHQSNTTPAAGIMIVSRPRASDVGNKKTAKFTIDMTQALPKGGRAKWILY